MEDDSKSTVFALLFPLKAGLFPFKSTNSTSLQPLTETEETEQHDPNISLRDCKDQGLLDETYPSTSGSAANRMKLRRRSSMSDIDKFTSNMGILPDLVQTGKCTSQSSHHLRVSGDGYDSLPQSTGTPRRSNTPDITACGSIVG